MQQEINLYKVGLLVDREKDNPASLDSNNLAEALRIPPEHKRLRRKQLKKRSLSFKIGILGIFLMAWKSA
jgi:hypothetical protein